MTLSRLHTSAISARTVAVVFSMPEAKYFLPEEIAWRLLEGGREVRSGTASRTVTVLDNLAPATNYRLETEDGVSCEFRTRDCAGVVDIRSCGADPSSDDNSSAFAEAISRVPVGGTVLVPAGRWLTGPLVLKSEMTLQLEEGAEVAALADYSTWPILEANDGNGQPLGSWEGLPERCFAGVITIVGAHDVTIAGAGVIDGGGQRGDWWSWHKGTRRGARRARLFYAVRSEDLQLIGITVRNSPSWTLHPYHCRRMTVAGIDILNPADSPNTDGFDPESCETVVMEGIHFSVGDDCIAIKAGKRVGDEVGHLAPTRDVQIRHCLMERGHGGVVLGSEMSGGIHDVVVEDCEMFETDRGLRLKTRRGRGGRISGVRFRRVHLNKVMTAFTANAFYFCDADGHEAWVQDRNPASVSERTPAIEDIVVEDVQVENVSIAAGAFLGLPEAPIKNIRLRNISVHFDPKAQPGVPLMADRVRELCRAPVLTENAEVINDGSVGGSSVAILEEGITI